jgi:hypothetical protein
MLRHRRPPLLAPRLTAAQAALHPMTLWARFKTQRTRPRLQLPQHRRIRSPNLSPSADACEHHRHQIHRLFHRRHHNHRLSRRSGTTLGAGSLEPHSIRPGQLTQPRKVTVYLAVPALFMSGHAIGFVELFNVMWLLVPQPATAVSHRSVPAFCEEATFPEVSGQESGLGRGISAFSHRRP